MTSDPVFGDRCQELVFIGAGMAPGAVTAILDACLLTDVEVGQCMLPAVTGRERRVDSGFVASPGVASAPGCDNVGLSSGTAVVGDKGGAVPPVSAEVVSNDGRDWAAELFRVASGAAADDGEWSDEGMVSLIVALAAQSRYWAASTTPVCLLIARRATAKYDELRPAALLGVVRGARAM